MLDFHESLPKVTISEVVLVVGNMKVSFYFFVSAMLKASQITSDDVQLRKFKFLVLAHGGIMRIVLALRNMPGFNVFKNAKSKVPEMNKFA